MRYSEAIITGASSGLGEEFAKQLAPNAKRLVLIARRGDRLEQLKQTLICEFPSLEVINEVVDLNDDAQIAPLAEKITSGKYQPDLLVNNAGLGDLGSFANSEWSRVETMLKLNMIVLTRMAYAVVGGMKQRKRGAILNVSSMASIMPIPDFAGYAATKAYVTSFSEALRLELKEDGIAVTALCPGPVKTEFGDVATRDPEMSEIPMKEQAFVTKERVVAEALDAIKANKARTFPGTFIKLASYGILSLPRPLLRALLAKRPRRID